MQLLASWKQSLGIFYPLNNLKLFGFAILRAVQVAAPQFFRTFWWLVGVAFIGMYTSIPIIPLSMVLIFLSIRPSVGIKNFCYWQEHIRHIGFGICIGLFFVVGMFLLSWLQSPTENFLVSVVVVLVFNVFFALAPLWFYFFLDVQASLKAMLLSLKRAFLMALYAFPAWLILYLIIDVLLYVFELVNMEANLWSIIVMAVASLCVQFVVACVWSVFYTKRLHEQFELYFPGPQIKE
jgi:hypothetical protein